MQPSTTDDPAALVEPGDPAVPGQSPAIVATADPYPGRVAGLDGLRGLAALYVLVFHCWLLSFRGFPANRGPGWLGWLLYGHLAVVFFLVLSGFALALPAARHGWQLGGVGRFARRRAWRIAPPYWAALLFSLAIAWAVTPQPHSGPPTGSSVLVYGLFLQDLVVAPTPNGAFWSIAVEAQLYVAFPLLLLIRRRAGALTLLAVVTVPVVVIELVAPSASPADKLGGLTPQLAPLFAAGLVAAGVVAAGDRIRRRPWHWAAAAAAAPVALLILVAGPIWTVHHYFWLDLAVAPAFALLLVAVSTGRPGWLRRLLATGPVRALGAFSYSLYLIHLPIVVVLSRLVVAPRVPPGLPTFCATLALAAPTSVATAWAFARVFELPFQRHRSWASLRAALARRSRDAGPADRGAEAAPHWPGSREHST